MVSLPTRGTSFRLMASSATKRTVHRARPTGGSLHTMAITRCFLLSSAPGRGRLLPVARGPAPAARRGPAGHHRQPTCAALSDPWQLVQCAGQGAIPSVCTKTFHNGIVLLESFQAVTDLGVFSEQDLNKRVKF